jgi:hypothetical protein
MVALSISGSCRFVLFTLCLSTVLSCATAPTTTPAPSAAPMKPTVQDLTMARYPDTVIGQIQNGQRFRNESYFELMAADGIRRADPAAVYARMSAATNQGENYKALYFGRLFTDLKPDNTTGWSNRAKLAAALGYVDEAAACEVHANNPASSQPVPLGGLPSQAMRVHPQDLSDWAGAVALMADAIAAKEGKTALVSFKNSVSGITIVTPQQDIAAHPDYDDDTKQFAMEAGPAAEANPPLLDDIATSAFSLHDAVPMREKISGDSAGSDTLAFLFAMTSAFAAQHGDVLSATQAGNLSGQMAAKDSAVPSWYSGGSYTAMSYPNGMALPTKIQPRPSGQTAAVDYPVPFLWASGGSTTASFYAQRVCRSAETGTCWIHVFRPEYLGTKKRDRLKHDPPPFYFPKLARLCGDVHPPGNNYPSCTIPVTLMEVLLNAQDVAALAPDVRSLLSGLVSVDAAYKRNRVSIYAAGFRDGWNDVLGFGIDGFAYSVHLSAYEWLTPVEAPPKKK